MSETYMKYKGIEIYKKPWWGYFYVGKPKAFTCLDKIYINKSYFKQLKNNKLSWKAKSLLAHEITHIKRFRKNGVFRSEIVYWLDKKFRYNEELAAIEQEMKVFKKHNKKYYFKKAIKNLSGFAYLWCVDRAKAEKDLYKIWENI